MVCCTVKSNSIEPFGDISGNQPHCTATPFGFFIGDTMKKIPLANNRGVALVDDEDFEHISKHKWYLLKAKHTSYATTAIKIEGKWRTVKMHRLIMNADKGQHIDHRTGNGLDNQRINLRFANQSQNLQNTLKRKKCSSIYKGVSWHEPNKKWQVHIRLNRQGQNLGSFDDEIQAAKVYDKKAVELFGEFARLNFGA